MLVRLAAVLAAAALLLAGCGGGGNGGGSGGTSQGAAQRLLAAVPGKLTNANSSKVSFDLKIESSVLNSPISIPGSGEWDYAKKLGHVSMDFGQLLSAIGQSGNGNLDVIAQGDVYYVRSPLIANAVGTTKPWIKIDATSSNVAGIDVRQLREADPSGALAYLRAVGKVEDEGHQTIGGTETTKYHVVSDLDRVAARTPAGNRQAVRKTIQQMENQYGISELPMDVWIDKDGLARRVAYELETKQQGQSVKASVVADLSDYGLDVHVTSPPADQVADLTG